MTGTKERIQKLERQVRFQRTLLAIVLLAAAVFLLASAASNDRPVEKRVCSYSTSSWIPAVRWSCWVTTRKSEDYR